MTDRSGGAITVAMEGSFATASEGGIVETQAPIAGRTLRFRWATPELEIALGPAFAHMLEPPTAGVPSITIDVWDSSSGAPAPVPLPDAEGDEAWYWRDGDVQVHLHPGRRMVSVFDAAAAHAWWWIEDARAVPWFERAAPMRHLVNWWAAIEGLSLVHAAAIGHDDGGALIVGRGGAGKSTLALAALASGLRFCGDDMVLLERGEPWTAHTVWSTARLVVGGERLVPHVEAVRLVDDDDPEVKLVADVWGQYRTNVATALPVRIVVRPEIGDAAPPVPTASAPAALELAASTFLYMPGGDPNATLSAIARLLEQVPVVRLGVGADLSRAVAEIDRLLEHLRVGA